jgi:hypothetical protein
MTTTAGAAAGAGGAAPSSPTRFAAVAAQSTTTGTGMAIDAGFHLLWPTPIGLPRYVASALPSGAPERAG